MEGFHGYAGADMEFVDTDESANFAAWADELALFDIFVEDDGVEGCGYAGAVEVELCFFDGVFGAFELCLGASFEGFPEDE